MKSMKLSQSRGTQGAMTLKGNQVHRGILEKKRYSRYNLCKRLTEIQHYNYSLLHNKVSMASSTALLSQSG